MHILAAVFFGKRAQFAKHDLLNTRNSFAETHLQGSSVESDGWRTVLAPTI